MKILRIAVLVSSMFLVVTGVHAEPTHHGWSSTTGFVFSDNKAAIEAIMGETAEEISTPVGIRWRVRGSMEGTFVYDPDAAQAPTGIGFTRYKGPNQSWESTLSNSTGVIGTYTGEVGQVIVRDAPGQDLVNVNMCGSPCGDGVVSFSIGPWLATNASVVWVGDGFQDGNGLPALLPPAGAGAPLAMYTFFNSNTGENASILTVNVDFRDAVQTVDIDIKPGSTPNCFNLNGRGLIPVAIIGNADLDVGNVDQTSLSFGGLSVRVRGNRFPQCSGEFVNEDAFLDLVCQFEDDSNAWMAGSDEATLSGLLLDGTAFEGSDSICLVP